MFWSLTLFAVYDSGVLLLSACAMKALAQRKLVQFIFMHPVIDSIIINV